ncbi:MFS transporter [Halieaceae bacterium IMCC8485]|uniref:MFS transporter n=1 Tax=Candidatus Seongchinamella marina TaxID=2518990 RepID=A0ABT3SPU3_9GAMM|nr:sugar porter family MFS transporter [Candidatus Seongchinamella marina]MCX2971994.1 MFS transporter [Candidatus Seongchinamella marina]
MTIADKKITIRTALIAALGGFLMGFDASVIAGVVGFIELEFSLNKIELGWSVASLALAATIAMLVAGPMSDRYGRKPILRAAAVLFAISALASAFAPSFSALVIARIIGGLGVGAALIIAPMYIAEIAPAATRGRMVSINQLNIVIGISVAFFSNYVILNLSQSGAAWTESAMLESQTWRWMLGIELIPAVLYFFSLRFVPESPRWLAMQGNSNEAMKVLRLFNGAEQAKTELKLITRSLTAGAEAAVGGFRSLLEPSLRKVMMIGLVVAILQQITGINAVFFYAPMIFEQSGIGTDASFMQAVLVGLTNLVFTIVAMTLIDKLGRKPLLVFGVAGMAVSMLVLSWGFSQASYSIDSSLLAALPATADLPALKPLTGVTYDTDLAFRAALIQQLGEDGFLKIESELLSNAINIQPGVILAGILGFVACFAISIGPVMWVLFSELFPNRVRGVAISIVGLVNSAVSFLVQLLFPWQLANLGNASTFLMYGIFALLGLGLVLWLLPETRGKTLEDLETSLVGQ